MKRFIAIIGTLLTVTILLSGSAVATWVYAISYYLEEDCTNPDDALYQENDEWATLGENDPEAKLGRLYLDLGSTNAMPPSTNFTVFGAAALDGNINETYSVTVMSHDMSENSSVWTGWDTEDCVFTTPSKLGIQWRYIKLHGMTGLTNMDDPIYGPEIDAVGWDKP
ncbi:MAG: hypothetical protein JSV09_13660 [Thermoplasmata archaeon]|nr:MAG: hypothetical protein JSV09_13660 [Thermoplasmata archaeon]